MLQLHPKGGRFALADPPGHTGGPVSYRPEGRNPPSWFSFSNSVVSSGPFKRQERTRSAVAALEVPHSRDRKWRTADWHPSTRHRSGLKIPPRPLSAAGAPSAKWCAILTEERGGRTGNASSPLSFPPFGNPPFLIPPPNSNPPKGGKPQGALARRPLWRGWGNRGAPLPPRSRAPPPFGFPGHSAACPPCASAPEGMRVKLSAGWHSIRQ